MSHFQMTPSFEIGGRTGVRRSMPGILTRRRDGIKFFLAWYKRDAYIRNCRCVRVARPAIFFEGRCGARKMSTNGHGHVAPPILLTISGFDTSCGAGTAADLKTFAAHGCYGVAAITALTVQNTQGVEDVHNIPSATLKAQLDALVNDCDIAAVKIGMLGNRGNAVVVAEFLDAHKFAHVVHDPVMKSSSGTELLDPGGIKFLATEL